MSTWVSAAPVIGAGSLDGFAIGALAAEEAGWLCEHVMAAEAVGAEVAAEAAVAAASAVPPGLASAGIAPGLISSEPAPGLPSAAIPPGLPSAANAPGLPSEPMRTGLPSGAMKTALPSETVGPELVAAALAPGLVAEAVAAALAAAPVGPVQTADAADLTLAPAAAAPAPDAEAFEASAEREESGAPARRRPATGRAARAAGSYRSRHRLGDPLPGSIPRDGAEPVLRDRQPSGRTLGSPRRTEARRMPRHAAPSLSFGGRITGFSSRKTGLLAPGALATGARG